MHIQQQQLAVIVAAILASSGVVALPNAIRDANRLIELEEEFLGKRGAFAAAPRGFHLDQP